MKGKSVFTEQEAEIIEALIVEKLRLDDQKQKGIRSKIRRLGFYASDFGVKDGYTVADFRRVTNISGTEQFKSEKEIVKPLVKKTAVKATAGRSTSDENYIIDLCDEILKEKAVRQHRFDFLRGDTGVRLPVDAYYSKIKLVVEYHERQHTEEVKFFDKRITSSGIGRGEQRKLYDERRKTEIPKNGLKLVIFNYADFEHNSAKRLMRNRTKDIEIIRKRLIAENVNINF